MIGYIMYLKEVIEWPMYWNSFSECLCATSSIMFNCVYVPFREMGINANAVIEIYLRNH